MWTESLRIVAVVPVRDTRLKVAAFVAFAPAGIPQDVETKLRETSRKVVQDPEFKRAMQNVNTPIDYRDGKEFQAFLDTDSARLEKVIRKMGKTQ